ncbi:hypothetical protein [Actinocrinis sp.]|uniref:hypothetical protein n=1 Tax=Actinocrinis sp. TaxID=1920516 RepID=UPI002D37A2B5|nr:hypothetical protein [Actinocrinis sp.]HZP54339.1 hypothetical protein [Actinocrinis sp.]
MTDIATEPVTHVEKHDARGRPTGHALCDRGDGTFPGGLLAHNSGNATCEACADWEPDDNEDNEDNEP